MPFVEGESLRDRLTREKQLPLDDAFRIAREVADALDYAHRQGLVHRDIKPENILLEEGHAVVTDFGIARAVAAAGGEKLTATGLIVGTPAYMSPEQAAGSCDLAGRSDLYSLGCVLYEMLAGQPPFIGPTVESLVHQHLNLEPRPVSALRSSVPPAVERALARAMAKTPADRFVTVAEFSAALEASGVRALTGIGPRTLTAAAGGALRSLAVLPLENLSGDPRQEYFADGMTEALIATLCRIRALRVISRTSIMTYKGARKPLPTIARELNVDVIMEGTVLSAGDEVRITAQLISAHDDVLLWSESFDRHLCDVLNLQGEVAREIAAAVRVELSRAERSLLGNRRQVDPEVYRRELMGRQAMVQRKMEGFRLAVEHFRQAIALDSTYAPVYAGLSEALMLLSNYGIESPRATHQPARDAAERALELDPVLHEGHVSLATILWQYEWNWDRAEHQIQRAIELNPGAANARHWHSAFLAVAGRFKEALAENHRAQELDPLSHIFVTFEGWILAFEGRDPEAMARLRYAIELDPLYVPALFYLGLCLTRVGRGDEAVEAIERAVQLSGRLARTLAYLVFACARAGQRERAGEVLAELEERARTSYVPPYFLAIAHGAFGHLDRAIEWLEHGYLERDVMMRDLAVDPASELLRQDERGRDVIRRMGLAR
jgi:serine/threonine-protein kinase